MKDYINGVISDAVAEFAYFDRKEDENLSVSELEAVVESGEVTVDEMVEMFRTHLKKAFK